METIVRYEVTGRINTRICYLPEKKKILAVDVPSDCPCSGNYRIYEENQTEYKVESQRAELVKKILENGPDKSKLESSVREEIGEVKTIKGKIRETEIFQERVMDLGLLEVGSDEVEAVMEFFKDYKEKKQILEDLFGKSI